MPTSRKQYSQTFVVLAALYSVALVVSNVIAGKLYAGPFGLTLPAAVWLFPIVYIIGDVVPEVYGLAMAKRVIYLGFFLNLLAVAFFELTLALPFPVFFEAQPAFAAVLGYTPRLLIASFIAYLVGTNTNAYTFVWIKQLTGARFLWMRTIGSTIAGETLDSAIFITIAFFGVVPGPVLPVMIVSQALFKIAYETLATPLTYLVIARVKQAEAV